MAYPNQYPTREWRVSPRTFADINDILSEVTFDGTGGLEAMAEIQQKYGCQPYVNYKLIVDYFVDDFSKCGSE